MDQLTGIVESPTKSVRDSIGIGVVIEAHIVIPAAADLLRCPVWWQRRVNGTDIICQRLIYAVGVPADGNCLC